MLTTRTDVDHTDAMSAWSRRRLQQLAADNLSGYVLKKDSPSCGMERVKVFRGNAPPRRNGRGLFADALLTHFPNLPVEEEGRLSDPGLRENFIERVFAYQRLRRFFQGRWTPDALVTFHTAHKMSLLSHSTAAYSRLGRLVASRTARPRLREEYERGFMRALAIVATTRRHATVLTQMAGRLEKLLDRKPKDELTRCIDEYRQGLVPVVAPITLLRHYVRMHHVNSLAGQTYLEPHPRELMLRSHV